MLGWATLRVRQPVARPKRPRPNKGTSEAGLVGVAVVFAASAVIDPTFVGLVVVAGRDEPVAGVVLAHALWITISQLPLVVLALGVAVGAHTRLVAAFERFWIRIAPAARVALTVSLAVAGLLLAADALTQLTTGRFLIAPDA